MSAYSAYSIAAVPTAVRPIRKREENSRSIPLISAFPADEISLWEWQEHAVYSRIIFGAVQEVFLDAGGSYVIDDEPAAGDEARHDQFVDLGVILGRFD